MAVEGGTNYKYQSKKIGQLEGTINARYVPLPWVTGIYSPDVMGDTPAAMASRPVSRHLYRTAIYNKKFSQSQTASKVV
jgi:hypothetical protein